MLSKGCGPRRQGPASQAPGVGQGPKNRQEQDTRRARRDCSLRQDGSHNDIIFCFAHKLTVLTAGVWSTGDGL